MHIRGCSKPPHGLAGAHEEKIQNLRMRLPRWKFKQHQRNMFFGQWLCCWCQEESSWLWWFALVSSHHYPATWQGFSRQLLGKFLTLYYTTKTSNFTCSSICWSMLPCSRTTAGSSISMHEASSTSSAPRTCNVQRIFDKVNLVR